MDGGARGWPGGSEGLVARSRFATTHPDVAEDFLRRGYVGDVEISGTDDFAFAHTAVETDRLSLNTLWVGIDLRIRTEVRPDDPLLITTPVSGSIDYVESDYPAGGAATGGVVLHPPTGDNHAVCEHFDVAMVQLDRHAVGDYAAAATGIDPAELDFHDLAPRTARMGEFWLETVTHVRDDVLGVPGVADEPILLEQAFRTLAATLLATFPNSAHDRATDPEGRVVRGDVSPARLNEVAEYLDVHAADPVRPTDLSDLAGTPVDEITEGMRRRSGQHPAELLWQARLRGVRRGLLDTDPASGATVSGLARRWGFDRVGRLRVAYAEAFGETPEQTLRR